MEKIIPLTKEKKPIFDINKANAFEKLDYLGKNYDPYLNPIPSKIKKLLKEFHLDPETMDPFTITNKLLVLLDEVQAESL